jgi:hypothetical protein
MSVPIRPLRHERDMIRALEAGTYQLQDLYQQSELLGLADRDGGRDRIGGNREPKFQRRLRTAVYERHRLGQPGLHRLEGARWLVEEPFDPEFGGPRVPRRMLLVWLPRNWAEAGLVLGEAAAILAACPEPIDLVVADPPWGLHRDRPQDSAYRNHERRNGALVVPGYVDVDPADYAAFTRDWIQEAARAMRRGGYLAVVTGPEQAARVQLAAQDYAGLTYVNSIPYERNGLPTTRRLAHAHGVVSLLTKGPLRNPGRVFHPPAGSPRGRNGGVYAVDVWGDIPLLRRPGLLRYDNALHPALIRRIVSMTTDEGHLVVDPHNGGGTTLEVCLQTRRRFFGGDINPNALRYTAARMLTEVMPAIEAADLREQAAPTLF